MGIENVQFGDPNGGDPAWGNNPDIPPGQTITQAVADLYKKLRKLESADFITQTDITEVLQQAAANDVFFVIALNQGALSTSVEEPAIGYTTSDKKYHVFTNSQWKDLSHLA